MLSYQIYQFSKKSWMLNSKFTQFRQSLDMSSSLKGVKNDTDASVGKRDSDDHQINHQNYGLDVQLSDNKKKMLEAFKKNSGIMKTLGLKSEIQPVSEKSSAKHENTDNLTSLKKKITIFDSYNDKPLSTVCEQVQQKLQDSLCLSLSKESTSKERTQLNTALNFSMIHGTSTHSEKDIECFVREVLEILGLTSQENSKMKMEYLLETAYTRFIDMKSSGRWKLIEDYFKPDYNLESQVDIQSHSIIKNKSTLSLSQVNLNKKRVRVIEPERSSELERTYCHMEHDLEAWVKAMTKGFKFQRCIGKGCRIESGIGIFSYDLKMFSWNVAGRQQAIQNMKNFKKIKENIDSNTLRKYLKSEVTINADLAFSFIFQNITYDFIAENKEIKQQFLMILREMRNYY